MAFIQSVILPRFGIAHTSTKLCTRQTPPPFSPPRFVIEAAKHARLKVTKEHERRRPRKHRPSDIHRKPPPYNPEPERAEGLPPVYTIRRASEVDQGAGADESGDATTSESEGNVVGGQKVQDVVVAGAMEDIAEEEMATTIGEDTSSPTGSADAAGVDADAK